MSKTLHLIRHAKSSWQYPDLADIDRPLNKRGKRDIKLMAKTMMEHGCDFNHLYCSPAERARLTIKGLLKSLDYEETEWVVDSDLYTFDVNELIKWCQKIDNEQKSVTIIGHNPALTDLCRNLVSGCEIDNMPTCAYVHLTLNIDNWRDLAQGCGSVKVFIKPKNFK